MSSASTPRCLSTRPRAHRRPGARLAKAKAKAASTTADDHHDDDEDGRYTSAAFLAVEREVFAHKWIHIGHDDEFCKVGAFKCVDIGGAPLVVLKAEDDTLRAFHNVCSHHAMKVTPSKEPCGQLISRRGGKGGLALTCPYHGWEYNASDGRLRKATQIGGMKHFRAKDHGLRKCEVRVVGRETFGVGLVFVRQKEPKDGDADVIDEALEPMLAEVEKPATRRKRFSDEGGRVKKNSDLLGPSPPPVKEDEEEEKKMRFVRRVEYAVASNWKVFCDNYLDGGYHVPYAHAALAETVDMASYTRRVFPAGSSLQKAASFKGKGDDDARLGRVSAYGFAYPSFMFNRYGPWLDTNTVVPDANDPAKCKVVFDYFLDEAYIHDTPGCPSLISSTRRGGDETALAAFVAESLAASDVVQQEDDHLCAAVQRGLNSRAYDRGRYNPNFEAPMHAFHRQLHRDYNTIILPR